MKKDPKRADDHLEAAFWQTLRMVIRGVSILSLAIVLTLTYLLAGDHIDNMYDNFLHTLKVRSKPVEHYEPSINMEVVNGIHQETGLAYGEGFSTVRQICLSCHSSQLIIQNKANEEGWDQMLTWMQQTQGLPSLGKNRKVIVEYLANFYGPVDTGRRPNLPISEIEWYVLELDQ